MFVGHLALALAARPRTPGLSLGVLVAATLALDLLWPIFLLAGIERVRIDPGNTAFTPLAFEHYPWSHSLLLALGWGVLAAALIRSRGGARGPAVIVGLLVVSHWVLDLVAHRPDLPLWPGRSPLLGFGLWNSVPGTLLVEGALYAIAISVYVRSYQAKDGIGRWALWAFVVLTTVIWLNPLWSPPPPSARAIAWLALGLWLLPFWAAWFDRHRTQSSSSQVSPTRSRPKL